MGVRIHILEGGMSVIIQFEAPLDPDSLLLITDNTAHWALNQDTFSQIYHSIKAKNGKAKKETVLQTMYLGNSRTTLRMSDGIFSSLNKFHIFLQVFGEKFSRNGKINAIIHQKITTQASLESK